MTCILSNSPLLDIWRRRGMINGTTGVGSGRGEMTIDETIFYCGRCETVVDWEVEIAVFVVLLGKDAKKVPIVGN